MCTDVTDSEGNPLGRRYVDYLGFHFDGRSVLLRDKTIQRSYRKADKKIHKYYARQARGFEHKTHRHGRKQKPSAYMQNSSSAMRAIGSKIDSQQKKFERFVRKSKRTAKQSQR